MSVFKLITFNKTVVQSPSAHGCCFIVKKKKNGTSLYMLLSTLLAAHGVKRPTLKYSFKNSRDSKTFFLS